MGRASLTPQSTARARRPQSAPDSQPSRETAVLPFRSAYDRRRDDVCDALIGLACAWRTLQMSDEAGWAAFAADAATSLACHLGRHFAAVRAAMVTSRYPSPWTDGPTVDLLYRVREGADGEDDPAEESAEEQPENALENVPASDADAVLLAFIAATEALRSNADVSSLHNVAGVVGATLK